MILVAFHCCDHLEPKLLIAIKDQVFVNGFKGKRLAQLLDDPSAGRMLRDVDVHDPNGFAPKDRSPALIIP